MLPIASGARELKEIAAMPKLPTQVNAADVYADIPSDQLLHIRDALAAERLNTAGIDREIEKRKEKGLIK